MRLKFTKMQGAGNDFVVLDGTRHPIELSAEQARALGDRRYGVGADQILVVETSRRPGVDFRYRIYNGGSGDEVEQCGNGARCFVRYVHDKGLSNAPAITVETMNTLLELREQPDGRVTVDMGAPVFELAQVPFEPRGLVPREVQGHPLWPIEIAGRRIEFSVLSMGNPHAVQIVDDVDAAPVESLGPLIESDAHFPRKVNAGFMQVLGRDRIRLRVYERGAGETLACGTGACATAVAAIRRGLAQTPVEVRLPGGSLTIEWAPGESIRMTGPATHVFTGELDL